MDFTPRTNLPDIRTAAYIHSAHGSLLVIPRERDAVRLYVQIAEHADLLGADGALGNRALVTPERLLEIARRAMAPYTLEMVGEPQWCAAYVSEWNSMGGREGGALMGVRQLRRGYRIDFRWTSACLLWAMRAIRIRRRRGRA